MLILFFVFKLCTFLGAFFCFWFVSFPFKKEFEGCLVVVLRAFLNVLFSTPANQSLAVAEKEVSHGILRSGRKTFFKKPNKKGQSAKENKQTKKDFETFLKGKTKPQPHFISCFCCVIAFRWVWDNKRKKYCETFQNETNNKKPKQTENT